MSPAARAYLMIAAAVDVRERAFDEACGTLDDGAVREANGTRHTAVMAEQRAFENLTAREQWAAWKMAGWTYGRAL